jgi:ubiquinone/menaquinone biosynthesis C-methylase UbiE
VAWYSWFSKIYDQSLESLYQPHRQAASACVTLGHTRALLLPCGTGQDLDVLVPRLAPGAQITCIDLDDAMLHQTRARIADRGWEGITLVQSPAGSLAEHVAAASQDLVVLPLGLSVFPDHEDVLRAAISRLRPGGQCVIFDCWARTRGLSTWSVELVAQADLNRTPFRLLEQLTSDYVFTELPDAPASKFGGQLYVASGTRPV